VDYLKAYDVALGKAYSIMNADNSAGSAQADVSRPFEAVAEAEMGMVNQAYLTITITGSRETREAAGECTGALWRIGNAAMSGDEKEFNREVESARE